MKNNKIKATSRSNSKPKDAPPHQPKDEDYESRSIYKKDGKHRRRVGREVDVEGNVITEGVEMITTCTGDVWLEVNKNVFDADLSDEMIETIEYFYPSLAPVKTLRDIFPKRFISRDDNKVCFKTGIYKKYVEKDYTGYSRPKDTSDFEFEKFYTLVENGKVFSKNPYLSEEI